MADPAGKEPGQNFPRTSQQPNGSPSGDVTDKNELVGSAEEHPVSGVTEAVDPTDQERVEDPVEILVGLAERGEIDPWNIDIIEVTDRFLTELERRRQLNLQVSGRTLFYAATLLRMKSEHLLLQSDD